MPKPPQSLPVKSAATPMLPLRLHNRTTGETLLPEAYLLTGFRERFLGMLAPGLAPGAIVGLRPCHWIHTLGLRVPLDVAYCDRAGVILHVALNLAPWRFDRPVPGAWTTWEASAGAFAGRLQVGHTLDTFPPRADSQESAK